MQDRPVVAVTAGDPAGVGPELCLRALATPGLGKGCVPVVVGDVTVFERVAAACGIDWSAEVVSVGDWPGMTPSRPTLVDCGAIDGAEVVPGKVTAVCGRAAARYVEIAVASALDRQVQAIATAPLHKEALHLGGVPYPGHTEMLAALTGSRRVCMMMASEEIVVSLATRHVPLSKVARVLARDAVVTAIELTDEVMRRLGLEAPRIVVCGLNPHAGEHGLLGKEEAEIVMPAIEQVRSQGITAEGPMAPDTAFLPGTRETTDAYVAMYHDQGLIPFKMLAFDTGVNVTLGLPIVRTSVDHGTAFDIAWRGEASAASLIESIRWAVRLAEEPATQSTCTGAGQ